MHVGKLKCCECSILAGSIKLKGVVCYKQEGYSLYSHFMLFCNDESSQKKKTKEMK